MPNSLNLVYIKPYRNEQVLLPFVYWCTGPSSAVGNNSACRSTGCEFEPSPVPYFLEINHEIISTVIFLLLIQVHVSYKQKYVHQALINRLVKLAQEIVWLG